MTPRNLEDGATSRGRNRSCKPPCEARVTGHRRPRAAGISDDRLARAIQAAACLVEICGEAYWPVFERLESELAARESRQARLRAYLPGPHGRAIRPGAYKKSLH